MSKILALTLALAAGLFLGAMFFGGLWWTLPTSRSARTCRNRTICFG